MSEKLWCVSESLHASKAVKTSDSMPGSRKAQLCQYLWLPESNHSTYVTECSNEQALQTILSHPGAGRASSLVVSSGSKLLARRAYEGPSWYPSSSTAVRFRRWRCVGAERLAGVDSVPFGLAASLVIVRTNEVRRGTFIRRL